MTDILRITGSAPVDKAYKKSSVKSPAVETAKDSVVISDSAKTEHLRAAVKSAVAETPDIRKDRVEEVKQKVASGEYLTEKIAATVADRIVESMGL